MELTQLENARQTYAKKLKIAILIAFAILAISIIVLIIAFKMYDDGVDFSNNQITILSIGAVVITLLTVGVIIFTYKDAKSYKKLYKAYFVERSLSQTFTDIYYDHTTGISETELKQTGMINTGDSYKSNDYFTGKYHDVALTQADVLIEEERGSGEDTSYVTIFKGRWMIFEFPKPFVFRLQVVDKHFAARKKPQKDPTTNRKIEKISTESITFDKKFNTYAEDGFEAYYILDPAFIENIEKLSANYKGKFLLCFIDNKLSVGIDNRKDAFEPPNPFKPLDEKVELERVSQDIKPITDFVDFLKLDHKLFTKNQGAK